MPDEVVGTIETVEPKEKGGAKLTLRTDSGESRSLHVAKNFESFTGGTAPTQGSRGKATFREWKNDDMQYPIKMLDAWEPLGTAPAPSVNGSESPASPRTNQNASFALSYAKDLVVAMVEFHGVNDPKDIVAYWLNFADKGAEWLQAHV